MVGGGQEMAAGCADVAREKVTFGFEVMMPVMNKITIEI